MNGCRHATAWKAFGVCIGASILATSCGNAVSSGQTRDDSKQAAAQLESSQLVVSAKLVPVTTPEEYRVPADSLWEDVVIRDGPDASEVAGRWEAELIAEGDRIAAAKDGEPEVVGVSTSILEPGGSVIFDRGGPFESRDPLPEGPNVRLTEAEITKRVDSGLERLGLVESSLTFEQHGDVGPAPLVVATVGDEVKRWVEDHPFAAEEIDLSGAPIYLEVRDPSGSPIEAVGVVPMSNRTDSWHDPAFGCFLVSCPVTYSDGTSATSASER